METKIALVNDNDKIIGEEEKIKVHKEGLLHRAFSIIIFNSKGEMLLQKRESSKYHSGGLWTNACCSHQRIKENLNETAHKRLSEEMGIKCELSEIFTFRYYVTFSNGLTENEIDHVFVGQSDEIPNINLEEAEDYRWISLEELQDEITNYPEKYTIWFKILFQKYIERGQKILQLFSKTIIIDSKEEFEIINITKIVKDYIREIKIKEGVANLFSKHTTLAIKINEDEPLLKEDFTHFLKKLDNKKYLHDRIELRENCKEDEEKNAKGHIKCLILETSQSVPISNYNLDLGKYQQIFAIETSGPRKRQLLIQIIGER